MSKVMSKRGYERERGDMYSITSLDRALVSAVLSAWKWRCRSMLHKTWIFAGSGSSSSSVFYERSLVRMRTI